MKKKFKELTNIRKAVLLMECCKSREFNDEQRILAIISILKDEDSFKDLYIDLKTSAFGVTLFSNLKIMRIIHRVKMDTKIKKILKTLNLKVGEML